MECNHATYRVGHSGLANVGNELYLFGGWNGRRYINHGLRFNVETLELVEEQPSNRLLPPPRRDHTLCAMGSCLLLFGGWSHQYDGNELWLLSPNNGWQWQDIDVLGNAPCSRRGHSANVIGCDMFVFGGLFGSTKYLNDLHIFNGAERQWIQPQVVGLNRPPPRAWHSANVVADSQIVIYGGCSGRGDFLNDIWVFDTVGFFWFQIECQGPTPLPRCAHSMVKVFEDCNYGQKTGDKDNRLKLMMFGGMVPAQNETVDVNQDANQNGARMGDEDEIQESRRSSTDRKSSCGSNVGGRKKSGKRQRRKRKKKNRHKKQKKSMSQETTHNKEAEVQESSTMGTGGVVLSDDVYLLTLRP